MRGLALRPELPDGAAAVDVVGTGGDGSGSLNLSTGAALLAAACGRPVVKHGNRAVSSRSGSADILEALGLRLPLDEAAAGRCLVEVGFTFLFAPYFHPAMRTLAGVRRTLGVRTVFNLLGPLTNPGAPPYAVLGAWSADAAALMAETVSGLPIERVFVLHGAPGWDEATPCGPFVLFDVRRGSVERFERDPAELGFARCRPRDLAGGDAAGNARRIRDVFGGERGPHRDALVLGAALALEVSGSSRDDAVGTADAALETGRAAALLDRLHAFSEAEREGARRG
jgi:anthranilate phosphoribosyltransferase